MNLTTAMLLRECARGDRQLMLINEFIQNGYFVRVYKRAIGYGPYAVVMEIGESRLGYSSWRGLKQRLVRAGFTVTGNSHTGYTLGVGMHV